MLLVPDNYGSLVNNLYRPFLDEYLGADGYDIYDFWYGYPDNPAVLLASLRQFDVVLWLGGGSTSSILNRAAARGGVLEQYLLPVDGSDAGRLMIVSRALTGGSSTLPNYFRQTILGVGVTRVAAERAGAGGQRGRRRRLGLGRLAARPHAASRARRAASA